MKIGTFARKFNINVSTVRFYINNGLLTPSKPAGQYEFDRECVSDMEKILKYKTYCFSLEEIQLLFFMEKASRFQDDVVVQICAEILGNKKKQLAENRDNINRFIDELDREIQKLPQASETHPKLSGVPYSAFPHLYCPNCQIPLKLDNASLSVGGIHKGELSCECGYHATIQDGIVLTEDFAEETPFKAFNNVESVIAMKESLSPLYRRLITKAYVWMNNHIEQNPEAPRLIMAGPFTFNFLLEYIDKMGGNNQFVVFDPSFKRIVKLQKYLASFSDNILYVVGKPKDLPVRNKSIDLYLDDYSTVNSMFTYATFSTEKLAPLLKSGGEVLGIFTAYPCASKSLSNFIKDHPNFKPEKMTLHGLAGQWAKAGVRVMEEKSTGETTPMEKHFDQDVLGEKVEVWAYHAKKE